MIITTQKIEDFYFLLINGGRGCKVYEIGSRESILRLLNIDLKALDTLYLNDKYKHRYKGLSYKTIKALLLKRNKKHLEKDYLHKIYKQDNLYLKRLMEAKKHGNDN